MNYDDAEYQRSNGAVSSGAIAAWNAGGTGNGINVAVVDSGINPNLAEFAGRIHPSSRDVASNRGVTDEEGHGTAVSAVIAANRNGSGMMGVAFESRIISLNTSNPDDCDPDDGCTHSDRHIAEAIDVARLNGARVINISLGGEGVGSSVLSAVHRAAQAGIVVVISAGNESLADPSGFALNIANQSGNGHVIIAGAMDENRNMAGFSNLAGSGAQHYLVALGHRVRTINQDGTGYLYSGTSFSAPVISGAAALLASAFPNLTGAEIVRILLSTADDAGTPGRDSTYGNGILNIARAFEPIGQTKAAGSGVAISTSDNGQTSEPMGDAGPPGMAGAIILDGYSRAYAVDLARTLSRAPRRQPLAQGLQQDLSTGHAIAGATSVSVTVRRKLTGQPQVGLAQTGMTYEDAREARVIAGHAVSRLSPSTAVALGFSESGRTLQQRLADKGGTPFLVARDPMNRAGFHADSTGSVGIRHDLGPAALTVTSERGKVNEPGLRVRLGEPGYSIASATLDRRVGPADLSLGVSRLNEESTVLGGRLAFAPGGSTSYFLDATAAFDLGRGWDGNARYRRGWTLMPGGNGLIEGGRLTTDAWSFDIGKRNAFAKGDRLAFRVMQPLRVRSGGYDVNMPVSYDYSDLSVGYDLRRFSLAPSGRELDFEAAYGIGVLDGAGYLGLNAFLRTDPGHVEANPNDIGGAIRFTLGF